MARFTQRGKGKNLCVLSIRLDSNLSEFMHREAKQRGINVSEFASKVIYDYKEKYYKYDKVKPVALMPTDLSIIINYLKDNDLEKISETEATRFYRYVKHIFHKREVLDLIDYCLNDVLPTSGWFSCTRNEGGYVITHVVGAQWTKYLVGFLSTLFKLEKGVIPDIISNGNLIFLKIK